MVFHILRLLFNKYILKVKQKKIKIVYMIMNKVLLIVLIESWFMLLPWLSR